MDRGTGVMKKFEYDCMRARVLSRAYSQITSTHLQFKYVICFRTTSRNNMLVFPRRSGRLFLH